MNRDEYVDIQRDNIARFIVDVLRRYGIDCENVTIDWNNDKLLPCIQPLITLANLEKYIGITEEDEL